MKNTRSKDTEIELILRKALWEKGCRYRKNPKDVIGHPDIVFKSKKVAVFCDGEFYHGKDWDVTKSKIALSQNGDYWIKKIERNIERDREINLKLVENGWRVMRFWGKDIKNHTDDCIEAIKFELGNY